MARVETAEMIARGRMVSAEALFEGRADLNGYPHQLLGVIPQRGIGMERVAVVMAGAEFLMQYGWELVNVGSFTGNDNPVAIMRRRPLQ